MSPSLAPWLHCQEPFPAPLSHLPPTPGPATLSPNLTPLCPDCTLSPCQGRRSQPRHLHSSYQTRIHSRCSTKNLLVMQNGQTGGMPEGPGLLCLLVKLLVKPPSTKSLLDESPSPGTQPKEVTIPTTALPGAFSKAPRLTSGPPAHSKEPGPRHLPLITHAPRGHPRDTGSSARASWSCSAQTAMCKHPRGSLQVTELRGHR